LEAEEDITIEIGREKNKVNKISLSEESDLENENEYDLNDSFLDREPDECYLSYDLNKNRQKIKKRKKFKNDFRTINKDLYLKKEEEEIKNYLEMLKNMPVKRIYKHVENFENEDKNIEYKKNKKLINEKINSKIKLENWKSNKDCNINKNTIIKNQLKPNEIISILKSNNVDNQNHANFFINKKKEIDNNFMLKKIVNNNFFINKEKENNNENNKKEFHLSISKMKRNLLNEKMKEYSLNPFKFLSNENEIGYSSDNEINSNPISSKDKNSLKLDSDYITNDIPLKKDNLKEDLIDEDLEEVIDKYELNVKKKLHEKSSNFKKQFLRRINENKIVLENIIDMNKEWTIENENFLNIGKCKNLFTESIDKINTENTHHLNFEINKNNSNQNIEIDRSIKNKYLINQKNSFLAAFKQGKIKKNDEEALFENKRMDKEKNNMYNNFFNNNKNNNNKQEFTDEKKNKFSEIFINNKNVYKYDKQK